MAERRSLVLVVILGVITIMVGSIPALISAAVALGAFKNDEGHYDNDDQSRYQFYIATVMAIINSLLGIIIKFPLIMFHFLTISDNVVDRKTKVFRVLDIAMSFVLAVGHAVSGILLNISSNTLGNYYYYSIGFIKSAVNASTAFCFIGSLLYVGVALLMIFFFFVHKDGVTTRAFTPVVQTTAVTNEPDEQEVHVNEENTSLIT